MTHEVYLVTLRDQLAMTALGKLIVVPMMPSDAAIWAEKAYALADAMIEARKANLPPSSM